MALLAGKVIAITGAASGIGLAFTKKAGAQHARVALADVSADALAKITSSLHESGVEVLSTVVDVSESSRVDEYFSQIAHHYGRLDGAANIAGIAGKHGAKYDLVDQSNDAWDQVTTVNLTGMMYCLRAQLRVMDRGGAIVNAASTAGLTGSPGLSAYCASKHAVIGLAKTAAMENGHRGIRVNCIAP